jgi:hypothetical protein
MIKIKIPTLKKRPKNTYSDLKRDLIRHESDLVGSQLFGPIPDGHKREFYCLDEHTWVWHEAWKEDGKARERTVRYEIRQDGVTKNVNGHYKNVEVAELENLRQAMRIYYEEVMRSIYSIDPKTGQSIGYQG